MGKNQTLFKYSIKIYSGIESASSPSVVVIVVVVLNFCRCNIICNLCFGNNSV